jgi:hypothetical protein
MAMECINRQRVPLIPRTKDPGVTGFSFALIGHGGTTDTGERGSIRPPLTGSGRMSFLPSSCRRLLCRRFLDDRSVAAVQSARRIVARARRPARGIGAARSHDPVVRTIEMS